MTPSFAGARAVVQDAIARHAFPAAAVEVGTSREVLWRDAFGTLTYGADAPPTALDTVFDLASLTKPIATTALVMRLVRQRVVRLEDPLARWVPAFHADATIEDALSHATGLPAWLPLYEEHRGRDAFASAIAAVALEYAPRTRSIYSDLGFMLLGFAVERASGATLDRMFADLRGRLGLGEIGYLPDDELRRRAAPTEYDRRRGRLLAGEVHDENAAALGAVAGHAGLFGTSGSVGRFGRWWLQALAGDATAAERLGSKELIARFTARRNIPGSSRALGWDTMLPTSSCGTKMSAVAFGHVGFTGTSLWIDPVNDLYVVLLTNRVNPTRSNDLISQVRPAFHDAVMQDFLGA